MRLWHYELIPYLDNQHLLGQWRECVAIKRKIDKCGTPNNYIVNYVTTYLVEDFKKYCGYVITEMTRRGFKVNPKLVNEIYEMDNKYFGKLYSDKGIFFWNHNEDYLKICYYNLVEKSYAKPSEELFNMLDKMKSYIVSKGIIL